MPDLKAGQIEYEIRDLRRASKNAIHFHASCLREVHPSHATFARELSEVGGGSWTNPLDVASLTFEGGQSASATVTYQLLTAAMEMSPRPSALETELLNRGAPSSPIDPGCTRPGTPLLIYPYTGTDVGGSPQDDLVKALRKDKRSVFVAFKTWKPIDWVTFFIPATSWLRKYTFLTFIVSNLRRNRI